MSERRIGLPRDPLIWLFVVTICVSIIGTYDLAREIGTPFPGYLSYRRSTSPTGEIDANTPVLWSGLIGNHLAKGDTLVAAAGKPYYPFAREAFAAGMRYQSASVIFRPPDDQKLLIRHLLVERFSMAHFTDIRLPEFITAVSFWLLAIVTGILVLWSSLSVLTQEYAGRTGSRRTISQDGDWSAVELKPLKPLKVPVTLDQVKADPVLKEMPLIKHSRLSTQPVTEAQARRLLELGQTKL